MIILLICHEAENENEIFGFCRSTTNEGEKLIEYEYELYWCYH